MVAARGLNSKRLGYNEHYMKAQRLKVKRKQKPLDMTKQRDYLDEIVWQYKNIYVELIFLIILKTAENITGATQGGGKG